MHLRLVTSKVILVKIDMNYSENKYTDPLFRKLTYHSIIPETVLEEISIFVVWLRRFAPFAK